MADELLIEGRAVPDPNYQYKTDQLVQEYKKAIKDIQNDLQRADIENLSRANARVLQKRVADRLKELDLFAEEWIKENAPQVVEDGVAASLVNLGEARGMKEAYDMVKFNQLNRQLVETLVADTQDDLLQVTNNVKRRVRNEIRNTTSKVMRENAARGVGGQKTLRRDLVNRLRNQLGKSIETGIVDNARRRWKPEDYADMITRTKLMEGYRESQTNEALERGAQYAVISSAGSTDACRFHEGRIIKLTSQASGNYPTYEELKASNQIFHPRCVHHYTVIRDLNNLSSDALNTAEKQKKRGDAALQSGKRNPSDNEVSND